MPLDAKIQQQVLDYVKVHIADEQWHKDFFDFLDDAELEQRLAEEFQSARFIYKLLEGIGADEWLLRAQVRIQVLSYASIYEATLHHLLFTEFPNSAPVLSLLFQERATKIDIPELKKTEFEKLFSHASIHWYAVYDKPKKVEEEKIRFDQKAEAAVAIGLIDHSMASDLIKIFSARNAIHIHAEIRKGLEWELGLAKLAYRRLQPFREQLITGLSALRATRPESLDISMSPES